LGLASRVEQGSRTVGVETADPVVAHVEQRERASCARHCLDERENALPPNLRVRVRVGSELGSGLGLGARG
jgi:hypothetical protein